MFIILYFILWIQNSKSSSSVQEESITQPIITELVVFLNQMKDKKHLDFKQSTFYTKLTEQCKKFEESQKNITTKFKYLQDFVKETYEHGMSLPYFLNQEEWLNFDSIFKDKIYELERLKDKQVSSISDIKTTLNKSKAKKIFSKEEIQRMKEYLKKEKQILKDSQKEIHNSYKEMFKQHVISKLSGSSFPR